MTGERRIGPPVVWKRPLQRPLSPEPISVCVWHEKSVKGQVGDAPMHDWCLKFVASVKNR